MSRESMPKSVVAVVVVVVVMTVVVVVAATVAGGEVVVANGCDTGGGGELTLTFQTSKNRVRPTLEKFCPPPQPSL